MHVFSLEHFTRKSPLKKLIFSNKTHIPVEFKAISLFKWMWGKW